MNFTREPIIETVITPREGCKLVVRSSKGNGQEDYFVDAVEVVSFGHSFFFRSQERPKSFLVPVSDYEILELKETRMILKNVSTDRSIKIGGGREAPLRREEPPAAQDVALSESRPAPERPSQDPRPLNGKRDKRRRNRRGRDRQDHPQDMRQQQEQAEPSQPPAEEYMQQESFQDKGGEVEEVQKAPSFISKLFPPPPTLIKDLSRYKNPEGVVESSLEEKINLDEPIFEHPTLPDQDLEDDNEE